jgi:ABC-type bacteriocin/lantibiotic exporter with double-glycine peptidase domain
MRTPWRAAALNTDCGPACLAMVLAAHGYDASVDELRQRLGTSRDGTTGYELARVARELGLEARGFQVNRASALAEMPLPAIAHYREGHFVVIDRVRSAGREENGSGTAIHSVGVVDPMRGRIDRPIDAFLAEFSGVLVTFQKTAAFRRRRDWSWLGFLSRTLSRRRGLVTRLVLMALLLQGCAFLLPATLAFVVDRVVAGRPLPFVALMVAGVPALIGGYALVAWLRGRGVAALVRGATRELLDDIFRHLLRLPFAFFHGRPVQDLVIRLQGADLVLDELLDQVTAALLDTLIATAALIALFVLYPGMSALVLGAAVIQGVLTWLAHRASVDDFVRELLAGSRLYQLVGSTLGGIADVKMIGVHRVEPAWERALEERLEARRARRTRSALWEGLQAAAQIGAQLAVMIAGAVLAARGRTSIGAAVGFYSLAGLCLAPIAALASAAYRFRGGAEALRRAGDVLATQPEVVRPADPAVSAARLEGRVSLERVSYRYAPTSEPVLRDIDLDIASGELVVLVGRTGSGKSTLARLLATLCNATEGQARIDGVEVERYDRTELRSRIGCVFQEHALVNGTVHENVTLGRDIPIEHVYEALDIACLTEEVGAMPLILATPVGAGGLHLSGGQRQRLCLARAIASRPAILVLDEATSSVDRLTERHIFANLDRLRSTRILATHRLYMALRANHVVVIDEGRIVQYGTHRELMDREGLYRRLWTADGAAPQTVEIAEEVP